MTSVGDVILTHVAVQPVAEIQVAVVEGQKYVSDEAYTRAHTHTHQHTLSGPFTYWRFYNTTGDYLSLRLRPQTLV